MCLSSTGSHCQWTVLCKHAETAAQAHQGQTLGKTYERVLVHLDDVPAHESVVVCESPFKYFITFLGLTQLNIISFPASDGKLYRSGDVISLVDILSNGPSLIGFKHCNTEWRYLRTAMRNMGIKKNFIGSNSMRLS